MTQPQNDFISASMGEAYPAYRNWYYVSLTWISQDGHESPTARKDLGLYFNKKQWRELDFSTKLEQVLERLHDSGRRKKGQQVGFGQYKAETVEDYRVNVPSFAKHGDGIVVEVRPDAYDLLIHKLDLKRRNPQAPILPDEQSALDWLRENARRTFDVMRDEDVPIWSPQQWWNTMPTKDAPAGFAIPRGLCTVVGVDADLPSARE